MSKAELLTQLKALVDQTTDNGAAIKREFNEIFPDTVNAGESSNQRELTETLSKLKITQSMKLPKFQKGDNFSRYCQRFEEYISICNINDPNLYMYFLQNVNDETYSILTTVELSPAQKADASQFCPLYKTAIYGDVSISLKNEVMECKQRNHFGLRLPSTGESIHCLHRRGNAGGKLLHFFSERDKGSSDETKIK